MVVIRVKSGTEKGRIYELGGETTLIGRERSGTIQILDQGVSRKHAQILRIGELYFIQDLSSRNGTFVNDEKVNEVVLRFGDRIQIGNTTLIFEDRLARLRDSQEILIDDSNGQKPEEVFKPSSTLQIPLMETSVGKFAQRPPEDAEPPESRRLGALMRISQIIGTELNLSKILNESARRLADAVDADNVFILTIKVDGGASENGGINSLEIIGRYDRSEDVHNEGASRSIIRYCLESGRAVLTSDAGMDARFHAMASVVMKRIRSVICVPITGLGKHIGVLYLSNSRKSEAFHGEDLELVSAAGCQLGTIVQLLQLVNRSDAIFRASIRTLVSAIEMRNPATEGQAERIASLCLAIAKELDWTTQRCRDAWLAGMLFDVGSIPLSDRDREAQFTLDTRKNHYAKALLNKMVGMEAILPAVLQQKERWDGSGSPEGTKGDEIDLLGQVLGLACEFESLLRSGGANGVPLSEKEALLRIGKSADVQFQGQLVNALYLAYRRDKLFRQEVTFFEVPA
jgi:pSer/pThr/pTyr-binding forkhead associated (FHA) protein